MRFFDRGDLNVLRQWFSGEHYRQIQDISVGVIVDRDCWGFEIHAHKGWLLVKLGFFLIDIGA